MGFRIYAFGLLVVLVGFSFCFWFAYWLCLVGVCVCYLIVVCVNSVG